MLGEKLKELREAKGFVQRQVASALDVDTAYISKMENNDKPLSRENLTKLSKLYGINDSVILPYWLAEKIKNVVNDELFATDALKMVLNEIESKK